MKCPYQPDLECIHLNCATMTLDAQCSDCQMYNNGVRYSKGVEIDWRMWTAIAVVAFTIYLIFFA